MGSHLLHAHKLYFPIYGVIFPAKLCYQTKSPHPAAYNGCDTWIKHLNMATPTLPLLNLLVG